jgi:membrane protein implicated in regulation of membrane protease activity
VGYALRRRSRPSDSAWRLNRRDARLVGARATVIAPGQVTVNGDVWPARAEDAGALAPGAEVTVTAVDAGALVVRPD